MWKWLAIAFVASVIVCGVGGYFASKDARVKEWFKASVLQQKPVEVRVEAVASGDVTRVVNAPGSIEPKTKVQISAQVIARITDLPFREGEYVRKDQVVVRLDSRDLAASLESAQAQLRGEQARLRGNEASYEQADRDMKRRESLLKTDDETKANVEEAQERMLRARAAVESSRHGVEQVKANILRATKDLENTTIVAPFDGTITKLNAEVGELVVVGTLNNASSVIMEIADLNTMLMKARVDESNIAPVKAGQTCRVFANAYSGRSFAGKVERVGLKRQVDRDGTGYFEVEVLVDKPKELIFASGLTANADIEVQRFTGVTKVPSQAIVDRKVDDLPSELINGPLVDRTKAITQVVYLFDPGTPSAKARAVVVKTGPSDLTHTIIEAGLDVGARVIVGPFRALTTLKTGTEVSEEGAKTDNGSKPVSMVPDDDDDDELDSGASAGPEDETEALA
ncbi:MAG: efflux RND transporter periplasmic adaptor subunit [Phycisphaerales bacterium]|nr:efflux RND transporter periplasmic adaptor subunit [Phycisphaerales bacterium]